jgi:hypothetical protein
MNELERSIYRIIYKLWTDDLSINQIMSVIHPKYHYIIDEVLKDNIPF